MILSRDAILGVADIKAEPLEVPEWGGSVYVRMLSGRERDNFEASLRDPATGNAGNLSDFRAKFASLVIADEKGERLFSEADIDALGKKSAQALDRVLESGMKINALGKKDVDDLTGN